MNIPKVYNLESPRTSKPVANQFVIKTVRRFSTGRVRMTEVFQSYDSIICVKVEEWGGGFDREESITVDPAYWDYSVTTLKYLKQFLNTGWTKAELADVIKRGHIKSRDLNGGK